METKTLEATNKTTFGEKLKKLFAVRELFMIILIVLALVVLTILSPNFLKRANLVSVMISLVPNAIIAIGMVMCLLEGTFDLSVGGVMAFTGTLVGVLMLKGFPIWAAIAITLLVGVVIGLINGFFIAKIHVHPLIVTYGMQRITRSAATILTGGYSIYGFDSKFGVMGSKYIWVLPLMVWFMFLLVVVFDILFRKTKYFRQAYYLGSNPNAALLSGIKVDSYKIQTFTLAAVCATIAGIVLASRIMAGTPTAGDGIEMQVLAAGVIGGCSMSGGEGTVIGCFLGVVFLALISNALTIMSVSQYWQGVVTGVILIAAVSIDMILKQRRSTLK
ncbi:MAG: ABC transporter permease [Oscillospiraceae bacterium]|nr:ABC transporter permease [Oscillospiraceae bacterium]